MRKFFGLFFLFQVPARVYEGRVFLFCFLLCGYTIRGGFVLTFYAGRRILSENFHLKTSA